MVMQKKSRRAVARREIILSGIFNTCETGSCNQQYLLISSSFLHQLADSSRDVLSC